MTNPFKPILRRKKTMEASLQKFGKSIRDAVEPDPNTLYGKRTTLKQGFNTIKKELFDEDLNRARKNQGVDESILRDQIRQRRTKKK